MKNKNNYTYNMIIKYLLNVLNICIANNVLVLANLVAF